MAALRWLLMLVGAVVFGSAVALVAYEFISRDSYDSFCRATKRTNLART